MMIGILKEIKPQENRVCMTPAGAEVLVKNGHTVLVETTAGERSGFPDDHYRAVGAEIGASPKEVFDRSDMVMHVKEPQPSEYPLTRSGQTFFTYFHFAASRELTEGMMKTGATCIAYETITDSKGGLPLLTPMSEVAGRMAAQEGAKYAERTFGGRGLLLGGVTGVPPARVLVIGGGIVGTNAAQMACGLGAQVYLLDTSLDRLRYLSEVMPKNCFPMYSTPSAIRELAKEADVIIGAVLVHGAKAPHLITRDMLKTLKRGTLLVDVSIDQGGCFETSRPTTHAEPTYEVDGVLHYCVANMPGAVPLTSTMALTNATLPYAVKLANLGWQQAAKDDLHIRNGVNLVDGKITYKSVAEVFGMDYVPVSNLL